MKRDWRGEGGGTCGQKALRVAAAELQRAEQRSAQAAAVAVGHGAKERGGGSVRCRRRFEAGV